MGRILPTKKLKEAVKMKLEGKSCRDIGKKIGVSGQAVWNNLSKPEIKREIERLQMEYLSLNLSPSIQKMTEIIHGKYGKDDDTGRKLQYRAVERTLEAATILPSQSQSVYINQLNQVNLFQTPEAQEVMRKFAGYLSGKKEEVVDASEVTEAAAVDGDSTT